MRKQFTFYESFASSISRIRKPGDRCIAYDAIVRYALYEEEPDLDNMPDAAAIVFDLIKPNLDSSKRKAENGQKGGKAEATGKQTESDGKPETNRKQTGSKPQANGKQTASEKENEKEGEKEKEIENECYIPPKPPKAKSDMIDEELAEPYSEELRQAVKDWVRYKTEKRQGYQPTGLRNLLSQIRHSAEQHGDKAVVDVIRRSMSANYQGIVFDWLNQIRMPAKQYTTAARYVPPDPKIAMADLQGLIDKI